MTAKKSEMLSKLERTFEQMGITVKYDKLKGDGGYCKYIEKEYIVINKILPTKARIHMLRDILKERISNGEDIYLMPAVREFIEEDNNEDN